MNTYDDTKLLRSQVSIPSEKISWEDLAPGVVVAEDQCLDTDPRAVVVMSMKSTNFLFSEASFTIACSIIDTYLKPYVQ